MSSFILKKGRGADDPHLQAQELRAGTANGDGDDTREVNGVKNYEVCIACSCVVSDPGVIASPFSFTAGRCKATDYGIYGKEG